MSKLGRAVVCSLASVLATLCLAESSLAGCAPAPTTGNDNVTCTAATPPDPQAAPIALQTGDDMLDVQSGNYSGGITGGAGIKTVTLSGGTITGYTVTGITNLTMSGAALVTGGINTGGGADSIVINGGTVNGAVQQGAGIDAFQMNGGRIGSLQQGDGRDTFTMTGGTIVGAFEDGDVASMSGGTIGRVDMKLDNNIFNMSGGTIQGNLVTGFGNDTIIVSNGNIGGNISVSGGADSVTITGGTVRGNVLMSIGQDNFTWNGGGVIGGTIDMGPDNDIATLTDLTAANLAQLKGLTGGDGIDTLALGGVRADSSLNAALVSNFETLDKIGPGQWTVAGTLTGFQTATVEQGTLVLAGDNRNFTGQMTVDAAGTLRGDAQGLTPTIANAGLVVFDQATDGTYGGTISGSGRVEKIGAGTLLLTASQPYGGTTDVLAGSLIVGDAAQPTTLSGGGQVTVAAGATLGGFGNVAGNVINNGTISVADAAPGLTGQGQGRFTIGGTLTNAGLAQVGGAGVGNRLVATNYVGLGGTLALNTELGGDGSPSDRLVIQGGSASGTTNLVISNVGGSGALTQGNGIQVIEAANGATTAAGAFQLGGRVAAGAYEYQLYRGGTGGSDPESFYLRNTIEIPVAGAPGEAGGAAGAVIEMPIFRPEVPLYSPIPAMSRELGLATLGTFHERQGDQSILDGQGAIAAGWGRVFGSHLERDWSGTVKPNFDGSITGLQAGLDLFGWDRQDGSRDRLGVFFGYAHVDGDVHGAALGQDNLAVGKLKQDGYSLGAYWTHVGTTGWYVDTVLMNSWIDNEATSTFGSSISPHANLVTTSLEGGVPFAVGAGLALEPQAQLIWQHLSIDDSRDAFSGVEYGNSNILTGRIGARLTGKMQVGSTELQPYLKANLWQDFSHDDVARFGGSSPIITRYEGTTLELGGGITARVNSHLSLYSSAGYGFNVGGEHRQSFNGNAGLRVTW